MHCINNLGLQKLERLVAYSHLVSVKHVCYTYIVCVLLVMPQLQSMLDDPKQKKNRGVSLDHAVAAYVLMLRKSYNSWQAANPDITPVLQLHDAGHKHFISKEAVQLYGQMFSSKYGALTDSDVPGSFGEEEGKAMLLFSRTPDLLCYNACSCCMHWHMLQLGLSGMLLAPIAWWIQHVRFGAPSLDRILLYVACAKDSLALKDPHKRC